MIQFIQSFYKQKDGCAMGGPFSVILADIHMVANENEELKPMNPHSINDLLTTFTAKGIRFNKMHYLKL